MYATLAPVVRRILTTELSVTATAPTNPAIAFPAKPVGILNYGITLHK